MRARSPVFFCLLLPFQLATAEESVFDLSLEQLAQISVSVSSKVELPLNLSPASVSAYNQQQLFQQGIHQLADLADLTPSYSSYSTYGERVFETRGQKAGSFENNKHLILLDGIRINHARANKAPIENELPLWMMQKLEVLRGPASALYGQSAFYGVVSLYSDVSDQNELAMQTTYDHELTGIRANIKGNLHSRIGHSYFAYSHFEQNSGDELVGPDFSPLQRYYNDQQSEFIYAKQIYQSQSFGDFTLGYIELNRQSGLGEHWVGDYSSPENDIQWGTKISYLSWLYSVQSDITASIKLVNNDSSEIGMASNENRAQIESGSPVTFSQYEVNVNAKLLEGEVNWQMGEQQSLILGLSYELRQEQGDYFATGYTKTQLHQSVKQFDNVDYFVREDSQDKINQGAYIQYYHLLTDFWDIHLTAGLRYDSGKYLLDDFSQWSPRVALVKAINKRWTIKASYSSALRAPSLKEYLLNDESKDFIKEEALNPELVLARLPDNLVAETINSTELSLSYQNRHVIAKFNTFYNQTDSLLGGTPITFLGKRNQFVTKNSFINNNQQYSVYGGELELQWRINNYWHVNTFVSNSWPSGDSKAATLDIPTLKANLSLTGELSWLTVNMMQLYQGNIRGDVDEIKRTDITLSKHYLNERIRYYLKITNVFDQKNYYAIDGEVGNPLPNRTFGLGLSYQF